MREFGVRRYGDTLYHHCMADSAADAANWFAHFQTGIDGRDFQALVKDVARPVARYSIPVGLAARAAMEREGSPSKAASSLTRSRPTLTCTSYCEAGAQ